MLQVLAARELWVIRDDCWTGCMPTTSCGGIRIVYVCVFSTHALASLYRTGKHFPKEGLTGHIAANARS